MKENDIRLQLHSSKDLKRFISLDINNGSKKFSIDNNQVAGLTFLLIEVLKMIEKKQKIVDENEIELLPWRKQIIERLK